MAKINLQPPALDLSLYAGDGISFRLICTNDDNQPVDVSGEVKAQIKLARGTGESSLADFATDMDSASDGIIGLSLTGDQTQELITDSSGKFTGVWDVQWTETGEEPRTLCQGKVECYADVTQ
jgi:hypothetical protein